MDAKQHLEALRDTLSKIFDESLGSREDVGASHYHASCIYEFSQNLRCNEEKRMLKIVAAQLESAALISAFGLYRQAFASLRLALEMGLGAVYFSVHRLELKEWLAGGADLKWGQLIDDDKGVLSKRFANAFFEELTEEAISQEQAASKLYRELSEFVHGNHETWGPDGLSISHKSEMDIRYGDLCKRVFETVIFTLSCRHLKDMSDEQHEELGFIQTELGHIDPIRELLGGPKEIS